MAPGRACSVDPQVLFYSEAGRGPRPLPPRTGVGRSGHFILLGNLLPFESFVSSLRPPSSRPSGSGRAGSVDLRGGGSGVGSDKSLTLTPEPGTRRGGGRGRSDLERTLLYPKVSVCPIPRDPHPDAAPLRRPGEARAAAPGPILISPPFCPFAISQ